MLTPSGGIFGSSSPVSKYSTIASWITWLTRKDWNFIPSDTYCPAVGEFWKLEIEKIIFMHVHLFIENNIIDFLMKVVYNEMTYRYMFLWKILKLATIIWTLIKQLKFVGVKIVLFLRFKYTATYSCVSKLLSGKEEVKLLTLIILPSPGISNSITCIQRMIGLGKYITRDTMSLI